MMHMEEIKVKYKGIVDFVQRQDVPNENERQLLITALSLLEDVHLKITKIAAK